MSAAPRATLPLAAQHHHEKFPGLVPVEQQPGLEGRRRGEVQIEAAMAEVRILALGTREQPIDRGVGGRGDRGDPVGFPEVGQAPVAHEPGAVGVEDLMAQREHRLIDGERARGEVAQGARRSSTGGYVPAGNVLSTPV